MQQKATKPKSTCARWCQGKFCLPAIAVVVIAGVAVAALVVLVVTSVRSKFSPDYMKWWHKSVVYQIYPKSFKDSNGDGFGDLAGITSQLDYFEYLNVQGLWISSFYPSSAKSSDYNSGITSHVDVDPLFGDMADLDSLLREAHRRDLRVIIDLVAGSTSSDHEWFQKSEQREDPYTGYYVWADGKTRDDGSVAPPNNWKNSLGTSAWKWSEERKQFYYHAFTASQPQLNYRSEQLIKEMKDIIRFWFDKGVDGIRVDAVSCMMLSENQYVNADIPSDQLTAKGWQQGCLNQNTSLYVEEIGSVLQGWRSLLDFYDESDGGNDQSKLMAAEIYDGSEVRTRFYDYGVDMPLNLELAVTSDPAIYQTLIQAQYDALPEEQWANFVLSSHNHIRSSSRLGKTYTDALLVLQLTQRGTPFTYYGEEIGVEGIRLSFQDTHDPWALHTGQAHYKEVSRDSARAPMLWNSSTNAGFTEGASPWLPIHPDYKTFSVTAERTSAEMTTIKMYRDLTAIRRGPSLQYGTIEFLDVSSGVIAYLRSAHDYPDFLVVVNLGDTALTRDFSLSPVNRAQGRVKVVTSTAMNENRFRTESTVTLSSLTLNPGDGLVIEILGEPVIA